ncbi:ABC transporter permease [Mucilaginibacter sp. X4EP1]|uniref:ABC transporter permease n=1 Tax=Mucilaginibacter sp. X4EP1 TaxID=2723092 RepID=UPI002169EDF8|nr:ABC transporter permease [Mucilaginibacter sp. X4EP1]MCS3812589.1 ABC-2 type transport system permease protein [Mucilaginibacter sp. X4EP1]
MNKVLLIIQREYITRVRKKSFIVMTLLVPALIAAMYAVIAYVATDQNETMHVVNVIDNSGQYKGKFQSEKYVKYNYPDGTVDQAKVNLKDDDDLVLGIPANAKDTVVLYAKKKTTLSLTDNVQRQMNDIASGISLVNAGIDTARLHQIKSNIVIKSSEMTSSGEKSTSIGATYALSFAGAILIYMSIFIYGAQVMRGVIEEKTSRIIEVIVSSVKPFQLMMGKIIGVGLVGLTQFILWIVLSAGISYFVGHSSSSSQSPIYIFMHNLGSNAGYEIGCFIFYWISGFLFYSALFAAVGSAVDSETETQQFMFPITLPLLFTYLLSVSWLFQAPDSPLAVWLSMIPLSAPVAMMVRIPYNVPGWQLGISMVLMIVGFLFTTYVASRIYRVGILMYGKKTSYKELVKWFFYKE